MKQSFLAEGHRQNKPKLAAEPTASISRRGQLPQKVQKMLRGGYRRKQRLCLPSYQINAYQIYLLFNYFSVHVAEGIQTNIGAMC